MRKRGNEETRARRFHASRITNHEQWNTALANLPAAHILQTWEWGALKSRHGWQPARYLWLEDDQPRAAASVLTRRVSRWSAPVMYVPKGPALDHGDSALLEQVLGDLEDTARQERAVFVKIDPDVRADTAAGQAVVDTLRCRGWRPSREQIQFRNTMLIDLARSPDDILADMKSKWRYNVRLAVRKGVTVRRGTMADLPLLYDMYAETAARDGFVIRPESYYHDVWSTFIEAGLAQPLIAEVKGPVLSGVEGPAPSADLWSEVEGHVLSGVEGEPVAMVIVFHFPSKESTPSSVEGPGAGPSTEPTPSTVEGLRAGGGRAWYMVGASLPIHREKMPNHLLQWEAMRWAQEQGCTVYDMWGAPNELDESDPLWGVYRFKRGFGGEFVRHIGAWDYPVSGLRYWLYTAVMPRVLGAMRWLYWRRGREV